jgi:hypothetical protein
MANCDGGDQQIEHVFHPEFQKVKVLHEKGIIVQINIIIFNPNIYYDFHFMQIRRLGDGGQGEVYLARHLTDGSEAALKYLNAIDINDVRIPSYLTLSLFIYDFRISRS